MLAHRKNELLLHLMRYNDFFFCKIKAHQKVNCTGCDVQHLKVAFKLPTYAHARRLISGRFRTYRTLPGVTACKADKKPAKKRIRSAKTTCPTTPATMAWHAIKGCAGMNV